MLQNQQQFSNGAHHPTQGCTAPKCLLTLLCFIIILDRCCHLEIKPNHVQEPKGMAIELQRQKENVGNADYCQLG